MLPGRDVLVRGLFPDAGSACPFRQLAFRRRRLVVEVAGAWRLIVKRGMHRPRGARAVPLLPSIRSLLLEGCTAVRRK